MAEPLKNFFSPAVTEQIARMIRGVHRSFDVPRFVELSDADTAELGLTQRAAQITRAFRATLPDDFGRAVTILIDSLEEPLAQTENNRLAPFLYLPHVYFVAEYGLDHFDLSMRAQYELTQRFTAEFSIRNYLIHHQERTLKRLRTWAGDKSVHVRRLVSEGTRPRLPWAPRLREFQKDPAPVLELLELLKDDVELYVRRSVANNLNDIGKDHPDILFATASAWQKGASAERTWIIGHALRSSIKRGEAGALAVLGFQDTQAVRIAKSKIEPRRPARGTAVTIGFEVINDSVQTQRLLVDFRIHYVKASGKSSPKVFKLKTVELAPGDSAEFSKRVTLAELTTRKHYAGRHLVDVIINGQPYPLGHFDLRES